MRIETPGLSSDTTALPFLKDLRALMLVHKVKIMVKTFGVFGPSVVFEVGMIRISSLFELTQESLNEEIKKLEGATMRNSKGKFIQGHQKIGGFVRGSKHTAESKEKIRQSLLGKTGPEARNWQGGKTDPNDLARHSPEIVVWREKVLERDNYTCQECKSKDNLHTHHIHSFSEYPELRLDIDNGITLCENCHEFTANYKGKCNNVSH